MGSPTTAWYYVAGLCIIGWGFLAVFAGLRLGNKIQGWWVWLLAVAGTGFVFAGGCYALDTWIADLTGGLMDFSWIRFVAFCYTMISLILLVAGLIPDFFLAVGIAGNTAFFAMLLPSLLLNGVIPGTFGERVESATREVQSEIQAHTDGMFG
jgi:hypothetical protein